MWDIIWLPCPFAVYPVLRASGMGDHPHSAFWQQAPPYASSSSSVPFPHPYHAPGYGAHEPSPYGYGYEHGLPPIRDPTGQHNSIHPAVQSSLWQGSFPSPTTSYHELRTEGSTASGGRSPSTASPPLPPPFHQSRSYSYGAPVHPSSEHVGTMRDYSRPLVVVCPASGSRARCDRADPAPPIAELDPPRSARQRLRQG